VRYFAGQNHNSQTNVETTNDTKNTKKAERINRNAHSRLQVKLFPFRAFCVVRDSFRGRVSPTVNLSQSQFDDT